jgi:uncharacterized protein YgiM (DUF1202 family)
MTDQRYNDNWQLQEDGETDDRWVLQESEQQVSDEWDLQGTPEPVSDWQPVSYDKEESPGAPIGRILSVIVTLALLAVIGYGAWLVLPPIFGPFFDTGLGQPVAVATPGPPATPEDSLTVIAPEATPTDPPAEAPAEVVPQPQQQDAPPAPVGASPAVQDQEFATVVSTYGVNARAAPSTAADVVRILDQGETFFVYGRVNAEGTEWLELLVSDAPPREGQPIAGRVGYASSEFFEFFTQPMSSELVQNVQAFGGKLPPTPIPAPATPAGEVAVSPNTTTTAPSPAEAGVITVPATSDVASTPAPATVSVTVNAAGGLNVRQQPDPSADIVQLLDDGTTVSALSRSANNQWIEVQLQSGARGWVFSQFVVVNGDLSILPAPDDVVVTPAPLEATQVVTSGTVPPAPFTAIVPADRPAVIVSAPAGVNARADATTTADALLTIPLGAVLPAIARSQDGTWVQVELPDGVLGWVFLEAVTPTAGVDELPVFGAVVALPTPTPTPAAAVVVATPTPAAQATPAAQTTPATDVETTAPTGATATVRDILLSVYPSPSTQGGNIRVATRGTVLPVLGRDATGEWVQVQSSNGVVGWVAATSVVLSVPIAELPVVQ